MMQETQDKADSLLNKFKWKNKNPLNKGNQEKFYLYLIVYSAAKNILCWIKLLRGL